MFESLSLLNSNTWIWNLSWNFTATIDDFWVIGLIYKFNLKYFIGMFTNKIPNKIPTKNSENRIFLYKIFRLFVSKSLVSSASLRIKKYLFINTNFYQKPEFVITVGKEGHSLCNNIYGKKVNLLSVCSPNVIWDIKNIKNIKNDQYCLFIDESIGHAPDAKFLGYSTTSNLKEYYRNLNNCFLNVEAQLNCNVIIAASGKVEYEINPFYGREIIYGKTNILTLSAELVIGHSSNGIFQAVCSGKPILITFDETFQQEKTNACKNVASLIKVDAVKLSNVADKHIQKSLINKVNREDVVSKYFCKGGDIREDYRKTIAQEIINREN